MSDLFIDEEIQDIAIVDGDLVFINAEEVLARQAVLITLRTFRGEWFRNILYGVPWVENSNNSISILGKTSQLIFDSFLRRAILSNEEVISILSYTSVKEPISGKVKVEATLDVVGGQIQILEEV